MTSPHQTSELQEGGSRAGLSRQLGSSPSTGQSACSLRSYCVQPQSCEPQTQTERQICLHGAHIAGESQKTQGEARERKIMEAPGRFSRASGSQPSPQG